MASLGPSLGRKTILPYGSDFEKTAISNTRLENAGSTIPDTIVTCRVYVV